MAPSRISVIAVLCGAVVILTTLILADVLVTVFFAITIAYVLMPLSNRLDEYGLSRYWAGAVATTAIFVMVFGLFLPIAIVLYIRRRPLLELLGQFPDQIIVNFLDFTYVLDSGDIISLASGYLTDIAISGARAMPILAAKSIVFAFVVFAILLSAQQIRVAFLTPIPAEFHDIVWSIHTRVRGTLFALYVIQAVTSAGTFLIALIVFGLLGYQFPIALSVIAGILQFVPVVGPSLLILGIAAYHVSTGAFSAAVLVVVLGLFFIGFLPDAVLRPRLARETANLPTSLYFVGFTGGILSLGPVGIIAGPLIVAILAELVSLLRIEVSSN